MDKRTIRRHADAATVQRIGARIANGKHNAGHIVTEGSILAASAAFPWLQETDRRYGQQWTERNLFAGARARMAELTGGRD